MPLQPGHPLSHYVLKAKLGAGGMGEVYQARDTRLDRDVAIKVLPEELSGDPERLQRFQREAKTLASLNHPNIGSIYGLDQEAQVHFLALELVPGEDLEARLQRGPLPVAEALDVCRQIAEGLEAAHEAGVVHRDLKPANIRITPDGVVKVLDFGLAKPIRPKTTGAGTSTKESDSFLLTSDGMVLGTPTYMSPEQARGKPVDRRTDIWAFGCVLYECLTGKRAFAGEAFGDLIAAILEREPDLGRLPAKTPAPVRDLMVRAFCKDPRERLRDIGEARILLADGGPTAPMASTGSLPGSRPLGPTAAWVIAGLLVGALLTIWWRSDAPAPDSPPDLGVRVALEEVTGFQGRVTPSISPDGSTVAWLEGSTLCLRPLDRLETTRRDLGDIPWALTWSPDSTELAFNTDDALWRVTVADSPPTRIINLPADVHATLPVLWTRDGQLIYSETEDYIIGRMQSVSVEGGQITTLRDSESPICVGALELPDGQGLLVLRMDPLTPDKSSSIAWLHNGELQTLVEQPGIHACGFLAGKILYSRQVDGESSLWALPFHPGDGKPPGTPLRVGRRQGFQSMALNGWSVDLLEEGEASYRLCELDLDGEIRPFGREHSDRISSVQRVNGSRLTYGVGPREDASVWSHDLSRGVDTQQLIHDHPSSYVGMLPDGRILVNSFGEQRAYAYPPTGAGEPETLFRDATVLDISPDGRFALLYAFGRDDGICFATQLGGDSELVPLPTAGVKTSFATFSPSGKWVLFNSDRSGTGQVYLRRFPFTAEEWQVSVERGTTAAFTPDEDAILIVAQGDEGGRPTTVSRVSFQGGPEVELGRPEQLFALDQFPFQIFGDTFDGDRFIAAQSVPASIRRVVLDTRTPHPR